MEPYTQDEIQAAYKELPLHQCGRVVLHDLEAEFYNIHTFSPSGGDRDTALFLEGCRWVVGYIKSCIDYKDPADEQDNSNSRNVYL